MKIKTIFRASKYILFHPVKSWRFFTPKTKRSIRKIAAVILIVCLSVPSYLWYEKKYGSTPEAEAGWWNDAWMYRKSIAITNSSGEVLTNQIVKATLNTSELISAGKMINSCNDIRVTDLQGNILNHWDVGCNTTSTTIYTKIDSLPSSGATIFVYYGNPAATSNEKVLGEVTTPGTSCKMMKDQGSVTANGVYYIVPGGNFTDLIQVYCDMTTLSDGWTVVLNSNRGVATNPEPNWNDAINTVNTTGTFGNNLSAFDLILGLKHWNYIGTTAMVQIGSSPSSITKRATYSSISLNASNNYALSLGTETLYLGAGTPGIKSYHAAGNYQFTTYDADHDVYSDNCSLTYGNSPWWYGNCWAGSFWGGGDSGFYQNAPFWAFSAGDYNDYGAILLGGVDTMKNVSAGTPAMEEKGGAPVAQWSFDEGNGTTAYDSSSYKYNGALGSTVGTDATSPSWAQENQCISGKCLQFNGTSDAVDLGDYDDLKNFQFDTRDWSFFAWVKPITDSTKRVIFGLRTGSDNDFMIGIDTDNKPYVEWVDNPSHPAYSTTKGANAIDGSWHQIGAKREGGTITLYVDGKIIGTDTTVGTHDITNSWWFSRWSIGAKFNGCCGSFDYGQWQSFFKGFIDEPRVYNYARTASQIAKDYNAGLAGMGKSSEGTSASIGGKSNKWMTDGLVGHWKMDETSWNGTSGEVKDASGNGNNGTAAGGATTGAGKYGNGGSFDGTDDYVNAGDISSLNLNYNNSFSISMWINPTDFSSYRTLISKRDGSYTGYYFAYHYDAGKLNWHHKSSNGTRNSFLWDQPSVGSWTHIILTYDANANGVKLYYNGILQTPTSIFYNNLNGDTTNSANVNIGRDVYGTGGGCFIGSIDETRIYNRALSPKEVADLYNYAPGPVGYWNMDDATGTTAKDLSGNNNHGTLTNGPTWTTQGKYGGATSFDGSDDYVITPDSDSISLKNNFTLNAWIKPGNNCPSGYCMIFNKENEYEWAISAGKIYYAVNITSPTWAWQDTGVTVNIDEWAFVNLVYDTSAQTIKLYKNGVLAYTRSSSTGDITQSESSLRIGSRDAGGAYFPGLIDDVKIYNYARTQKQIVEDMNAGHPAGGSPVGSQVGYWKFDEGNGTTANNSGNGGSALNGTISGATWSNEAKFGKALSFDGSNDYVSVPSSNSLAFGTNDFTVSLWANLTNGVNYQHFVAMPDQGTFGFKAWRDSGNKIYFYSSAFTTYPEINATYTNNSWNHLVLIRRNQVAYIYVNGVLAGSKSGFSNNFTANILNIGNGYSGEYTQGKLDELKIYNYALTDSEIQLDYNQGKSMVLGSKGTESDGKTPSNSSSRAYCPPGNVEGNCAPGLNPAPVGEWNFEEGSGTTAKDTSGNNNTGTLTGGTTWNVGGKKGGAASFDGVDDYVISSTINHNIGTGNITYSAWINPRSYGGSPTGSSIISNGEYSPLFFVLPNHNLAVYWSGSRDFGCSINLNTWSHVVMERNNGIMSAYLNGQACPNTHSLASSISNNQYVFGRSGISFNGDYFNGLIDDVKIYNYARTPAQIAWDYNRGAPVGWWRMDDSQGSTAKDYSGNGNNGTLTNMDPATDWVTGKNNGALDFDGSNDYVVKTSANSLNGNGENKTISAWVYHRDNDQDRIAGIFQCAGCYKPQYSLMTSSASGTPCLRVQIVNSGDVFLDRLSTLELTPNVWHFVAFTYDGTYLTFFIDEKSERVSLPGTVVRSDAAPALYIGVRGDAGAELFNGQIDDVRIYNYALSAEQVKQIMNDGAVNFR